MSTSRDDSMFEEMERYRRNNVELAVALNELKTELNIVQMHLLDQKRELQNVYDENAMLKKNLTEKDNQLNVWRTRIVDLVTANTRKYTELMQSVGLVPATNETVNSTMKEKCSTSQPKSATEQMNVRSNVQRRKRVEESPTDLANVTEESLQLQLSQQINESRSFTPSPEKNTAHVTSRRRVTDPPMTPASPLRVIQERMVGSGESKKKKSSAKVEKMEKIIDENTQTNGKIISNGRSQRRAAPKNLSEPKLGTKLRRQ